MKYETLGQKAQLGKCKLPKYGFMRQVGLEIERTLVGRPIDPIGIG